MSHSPTKNAADDSSDPYERGWSEMVERIRTGGTWSGHERNCAFLNTGAERFADVSAVTGLDFPDDARGLATVDWDLDGDLDVWHSCRTAPRLRFVRNETPQARHFVAFKLVGRSSNRDAIGARVELALGEKTLIKTVHAGDGYLSQSSKWVHFGLGDAASVERVSVRWPGGGVERFTGIGPDARYTLSQGEGRAELWRPPSREVTLEASRLPTQDSTAGSRIVLFDRIPLPALSYQDGQGQRVSLLSEARGPVLVNLWATWCAPCVQELGELAKQEGLLRDVGLNVLALSVDGLTEGGDSEFSDALEMMKQLEFPFEVGAADRELLDTLDVFQELLISLRPESGQLPTSYLIDEWGRLAVIYVGPVEPEQLLSDVEMLGETVSARNAGAFPFLGRWFVEPQGTAALLAECAKKFAMRQQLGDAVRYAGLAADLGKRAGLSSETNVELASIFLDSGTAAFRRQDFAGALRDYRGALSIRPGWAEAHTGLGNAQHALGDTSAA
ncbi:MAG: hypothetical protein CMJ48_03210, partial [Planctomycetaceae bacterium]|nr:hypothetical protein [Planctomycetaceae bacterium]